MAKKGTPEHPKTLELASVLGVDVGAAMGYLECLWQWASNYATDGAIGRYSNQVIVTIGCKCSLDPDRVIAAMLQVRWLDESQEHRLVIHDFEEHATEGLKKYNKNRGTPFAKGSDPRRNTEGRPAVCRDTASDFADKFAVRGKPFAEGRDPRRKGESTAKVLQGVTANTAKVTANENQELQTENGFADADTANAETISSKQELQKPVPRACSPTPTTTTTTTTTSSENKDGSDYNTGESHPPAAAIPNRQENSFSFAEQGTTRRQGLARIGNLIRPPVPKPSSKASPETNNPTAMAESAEDRRLREIHEQNKRRAMGGQA